MRAGSRSRSGCNNTCTFCIVPSLRGKETDRRPGDVLAEIRALVEQGVIEVTLLGQNVNTYGVEFGDRLAFGKLLRACGEIDGLERVRFTSPHPAAFTEDVIVAMAETPNVMPSLHMPLQSGSDRVLKAMRRSYRQREVPRHHRPGPRAHPRRGDHHRHHRRLPRRDRGGLPGHARRRPRVAVLQRLHLPVLHPRRHARGDDGPTRCPRPWSRSGTTGSSRSRRRSPGPGTGPSRAARSRCSSPPARAARTPRPTACRAAPATTGWSTSRCPSGAETPRPGDLVTVGVTYGAPHHLVADCGRPAAHTGSVAPRAATPGRRCRSTARPSRRVVGMPAVGRPAPVAGPDRCATADRSAPDSSTGTNPVSARTADPPGCPSRWRPARVASRSTLVLAADVAVRGLAADFGGLAIFIALREPPARARCRP